MKRYLKTALILSGGLLCFQIIASLGVYLSNMKLKGFMEIAAREGYLVVPNMLILDRIQGPGMALAGGLFFTLSLGALLCLASLGTAWLYPHLPGQAKTKALAIASLGTLFLICLNLNGFLLFETVLCTLPWALVFFLYRRSFRNDPPEISLGNTGLHAVPPLILAGVLLVLARGGDSRIFSDFRDTFLMSNPVGMSINDFYYRYTLAPAEVFKSLDQKLIKHGELTVDTDQPALTRRLEQELLSRDYLLVEPGQVPDLTIRCQGDHLSLLHGSRLVLDMSVQKALADPRTVFNDFSQSTDTYVNFRKIIGLALLSGLPLLMYLAMHALFFCPAGLFMTPVAAARTASSLCLVLGLAAFGFLAAHSPETVDKNAIASGLLSDSPAIRTAALHVIHDEKLNIIEYPQSRASATSAFVPERYWFARASAYSHDRETYVRLLALLDDPHPNVQCQAFFALGMMGKRQAVPEIIRRIKSSDHWYVQWYAYKALKRLGWTQKKSRG